MINPEVIVRQLFPQDAACVYGTRNIEVNGLSAGAEPENCEILIRGQAKNSNERREFFLVRTREALAFLRVCAAMSDSGYAEFAVIREIQQVGSTEATALEEYARESIVALCGQ